jgi:hypothetical protein
LRARLDAGGVGFVGTSPKMSLAIPCDAKGHDGFVTHALGGEDPPGSCGQMPSWFSSQRECLSSLIRLSQSYELSVLTVDRQQFESENLSPRPQRGSASANLRNEMLSLFLIGSVLVATTVIIHAVGMASILRPIFRFTDTHLARLEIWPVTWLVIRTTWYLIFIHLVEIALWGFFYWSQNCLPDAESAFYFAGVTYTTVGYGDLVLAKEWRLLGPIEGLTGILMCGLSTGFFFAMVNRIYTARMDPAV